jgi:Glycosyl transferase family 2
LNAGALELFFRCACYRVPAPQRLAETADAPCGCDKKETKSVDMEAAVSALVTQGFAVRQESSVSRRPAEAQRSRGKSPAIAVIVPCYNEEASITKVVTDFHAALPTAEIYVYDNNSTDATVAQARAAGAIVRAEPLQGKGNVVRRMFADVEADIYVLVDGDDTYDAPAAAALVDQLQTEQLDMVTGQRNADLTDTEAYRRGHRFGNWLLTTMVTTIFGDRLRDMLSGYRVLSRRFVKSFPCLTSGFEIETELTVHALELKLPMKEVRTHYRHRPPGAMSKLRTVRDGIRILRTIVQLVKDERPLWFFGVVFAVLGLTSIILATPVIQTWRQTGLVPRLPTAILATGLMLLGFLSLACGMILETVTRGRREAKRMRYLSIPLFAPRGE